MRLKDRVALITGASSGIGKAIATRFAAEGAHVAVNYRPGSAADAEGALAEASSFGPSSTAVIGDVSKREDVERMMAEIIERFGRIDIAINNAGIEIKKPFLEITDDEWNEVIAVNLFGPFLVSQVAAKQMVKQGQGGKLLFISSVHEDIPFPQYTAYCASKGGIRMMMRNLAMELAQYKINVNNIAPGAIATPVFSFETASFSALAKPKQLTIGFCRASINMTAEYPIPASGMLVVPTVPVMIRVLPL